MKRRRTCRLTPGTRFPSKIAAQDAELERRINGGVNGQRGAARYEIKPCQCNGWHLTAPAGGSSP